MEHKGGGARFLGKPQFMLLIAVLFTFLALINSLQVYGANNVYGNYLPWRLALLWGALTWCLWLPVIPLLLAFGEGLQRAGVGWGRRLLVFGLTGPLFAVCHSLLVAVLYFLAIHDLSRLGGFLKHRYFALMTDFLVGCVLCAAVLAAAQAVSYYQRFEDGRLRAVYLESQLAQAQLQALKMQLQPHFLFNTLNSIHALQLVDLEGAQRMTARLGDFLRLTLHSTACQEVTLKQELEFLNCYLDIERIRFGDRLSVGIDAGPDTLQAQVPNLVLQPIVENAIRHGINARIGPGRLVIRARRENGELRLEVNDNGPGIPEGGVPAISEGVGLRNTRERLRQMYGPSQRLEMRNAEGGGLEVEIAIPFECPAENGDHS